MVDKGHGTYGSSVRGLRCVYFGGDFGSDTQRSQDHVVTECAPRRRERSSGQKVNGEGRSGKNNTQDTIH